MKPSYNRIHHAFKLNGIACANGIGLKEIAHGLVNQNHSYKKSIGNFLLDWLSKAPTIAVQTSGSTGTPKSIVLQKTHMVNSALATGSFFNLKAGDKAFHCLPTEFIAGKMMLVRAMVLGLELDCVEPTTAPIKTKKEYGFCAMVPLQVEASLKELPQIKTLIVGGAPMSQNLKEKVQGLKTQIFETYGMTETITHIAAKKVSGLDTNDQPFFKLLPNVSISQDGRDCLVIEAPKIADQTLVTNDIVKMHSNTTFEWLGRYDNIINSGGIKLIPEAIEAKLSQVLKNNFFVIGLPDETLGEKLVLVMEGEESFRSILDEIKASKTLQKFQIPKEVLFVSEFVESNGKINRKKTIKKNLPNS